MKNLTEEQLINKVAKEYEPNKNKFYSRFDFLNIFKEKMELLPKNTFSFFLFIP